MEEEIRKLTDVYKNLSTETWELMLRNLETYQALYKMWLGFVSPGEEKKEDIYESWRLASSRLYGNVFELFTRPIKIATGMAGLYPEMATAYSQWLKGLGLPAFTPSRETIDAYSAMYKVWADMAGAPWKGWQEVMERLAKGTTEGPTGIFDAWFKAMMPTEAPKLFQISEESWGKLLPAFSGFTIPKAALESQRKSIEAYTTMAKAWIDLQSRLYKTWIEASAKFSEEMQTAREKAQAAGTIVSFQEFAKAWMGTFGETYDILLKSKEYVSLQAELTDSMMDFTKHARDAAEAFLSQFPILPVPLRSEMNEVEKDLHSLEEEVAKLNRKLDELLAKGRGSTRKRTQ